MQSERKIKMTDKLLEKKIGNTLIDPEAVHELSKSLSYQNYRYNRLHAPDIPVSAWGLIFDNVEAMEAMLQAERN
jgi:hypothetical protein